MYILIVDDQKEDYQKFSERLIDDNPSFKIEYASDAIEGISVLEKKDFDILILDQIMGGPNKDGTDLLRNIKRKNINKIPEIIFVTGNYYLIPAETIVAENVPITLFLEKDSSFFDTLYRGVMLIVKRMIGGTKYQPKDLFGDQFIKLILEEANQVVTKDLSGYYSTLQRNQIGTMIRSYINSLKMRSEWDEDDVLELSIFFAEGICKIFKIPDELIKVLKRFLNVEEILYTIPHYRDHFFHQLKVFFLGFCIINELNRNRLLAGNILETNVGIKTWFVTSVFHDIGYPFEKMKSWLNSFIMGVLKSPKEKESNTDIVPLDFHWGALFGKKYHWYHLQKIISIVCNKYDKTEPSYFAELISDIASSVSEEPDHGIYSSLILQNFLRERLSEAEIDSISVAVALHNNKISELVRQTLNEPLSFERDPLSFLLAYCDIAQDWGRVKPSIDKSKGYSKFGFPSFASNNIFDRENKIVNINLCYENYLTVPEQKEWYNTIFSKHIQPMKNYWTSRRTILPKIDFSITYYHQNTNDKNMLNRLEL